MNDSHSSSGKRQRTQRGVSLIEVLVVLVILVTGILTIIRLFPSGFFSIQSTGNAALGDGLGSAAISVGAQDSGSLPEAILPDNLAPNSDNLLSLMPNTPAAVAAAAAYSNYDPDDPNNLENARVISNETVAVPTASNGQSVYVVKYGPVSMPADPAVSAAQFPSYFTVSSPNWTPQPGSSAYAPVAGAPVPVDVPQDTLVPGQERFLVDLANQEIAVPYAGYTLTDHTTTPQTYMSYDQKIVVVIHGSDGKPYTQYLDVPQATPQNSTNPYAPKDGNNPQGYLPDTATNYQGGWFSPTGVTSTGSPAPVNYPDQSPGISVPQQALPSGVTWLSVTLYRSYNGVVSGFNFNQKNTTNDQDKLTLDPYQFKLTAANIFSNNTVGSNPGAIGFSPKAATGSGALARKVRISYITTSWQILREDHDIPALTGTGSTFVVRTTVPNLLLAGSANPDNSINPGIAGSGKSLIIMDLDTGLIVAPGGTTDPTNPDSPLNNEDLNGTTPGPSQNLINISYSTGRLTFGSNAFGDNSKSDGSGTAPAHRIRIFYTADLNWTVAVQKAPASYTRVADVVSGSDPLIGGGQCAFDPTGKKVLYFPHSDYGKTVAIDNLTAYDANGKPIPATSPEITLAIGKNTGDTLDMLGTNQYWDGSGVSSYLPATLYPKGPNNAYVTFTVRGLSTRAVAAWKERNLWKVHSVDAVLNRTP